MEAICGESLSVTFVDTLQALTWKNMYNQIALYGGILSGIF